MRGFIETTGFIMLEVVLLAISGGMILKTVGAVFNPDREIVNFNAELLVQKINAACAGSKESMVKLALPQPSPSKMAGASEFLAKFAIAGSRAGDPNYVLYYEAFPVGEAVGWEVYHNFDTRSISVFDAAQYKDENGDYPFKDRLNSIGNTIRGADVDKFMEAMKAYQNAIIMGSASSTKLSAEKKQILISNIILSDDLNVIPQEKPASATKGFMKNYGSDANAGQWVGDRFEFTDYLGLSDVERTYIKYRVCRDNALCLKTRDSVRVYPLSEACRGKYLQLLYDARADTDSIIAGAIIGKDAAVGSAVAAEDAYRAEKAAKEAAKAADAAASELKNAAGPYSSDFYAEGLRELAKNSPADIKSELDAAINEVRAAADNAADAKIVGNEAAKKAAEERLDNINNKILNILKKDSAIPPADVAERAVQLKKLSVLEKVNLKTLTIAEQAAAKSRYVRAALKASGVALKTAEKVTSKMASWLVKASKTVCFGPIKALTSKFCIMAGAVAGAGVVAFTTIKGVEFAKGILAFTQSFKVSDFYMASPCLVDGRIQIENVVEERQGFCTGPDSKDASLCKRLVKYPIYEYSIGASGDKEIEHKGFHYTCMDSIGDNSRIEETKDNVGCIRIKIETQKDGFCFTKNPWLERKDNNPAVKIGATTLNAAIFLINPIPVDIGVSGGFGLNDITEMIGHWGYLPVKETTAYMPASNSVELSSGELANSVGERVKEILVDSPLGLSWSWPS